MAPRAPLLAAACALLLAGCIEGEVGGLDDRAERAQGLLPAYLDTVRADHDHKAPQLHESVTPDFTRLGGADFLGQPGKPGQPASYNELSLWEDYAFVTVERPFSGFLVADISDPAAPTLVSTYETGHVYHPELNVSDDGNWVFLSTHGPLNSSREAWLASFQGSDGLGPLPNGVHAIDVSDKAAPRFSSYYSSAAATPAELLPGRANHTATGTTGVHNTFFTRIDGQAYLLMAKYGTNGVVGHFGAPSAASPRANTLVGSVEIARFDEVNGRGVLARVGEYVDGSGGVVHDVVVQRDALLGKPVAVVSYWDSGVQLVDLSDPANPALLAKWDAFDDTTDGNIHSAMLHFPGDGSRLLLTAPEYFTHQHTTGYIYVLDATDLGEVRRVGQWVLPAEWFIEGEYVFSPHQFDVAGNLVYLAHNHAGVVVLDISDPANPTMVSWAMHAEDTGHELVWDWAPDVWSAWLHRGHVWFIDRGAGLYAWDHEGLGTDRVAVV